uniref:Uncharacterized protein n=1 Tax=virus sp. ct5rm7 TaxID=2827298 RepID=A0A8S5RGQ5_9VIRU|nr:MAG TPA: hypothetical protein [virus sp. ct5rm7]
MSSDKSNQLLIREAIRKIALGRSMERIGMAPGGMSGIGTARMIHGYVAKIHDDPSDEEFTEYGGTVDVGEYPDETASPEPVIHKGVLLAAATNNEGGFLLVPTLFSDVTIFMDAATRYAYVVNFSHVDIIRLDARKETTIGVTETEEMDADSDSSPDYDELEPTGNAASTQYTAHSVTTTVKNDKDKEATTVIDAESIAHKVDKSEVKQTADKVVQKVNSTTIAVANGKVTLGDEQATEPLVLGNELAQLMLDFLTECSKIMTPTLMGTMQPLNFPNFISLTSRIQKFLSKTSYTK